MMNIWSQQLENKNAICDLRRPLLLFLIGKCGFLATQHLLEEVYNLRQLRGEVLRGCLSHRPVLLLETHHLEVRYDSPVGSQGTFAS